MCWGRCCVWLAGFANRGAACKWWLLLESVFYCHVSFVFGMGMNFRARTARVDRFLLDLVRIRVGRCDEPNDMRVVGQPAMSRNFEEIRALPWVGNKYAFEKVSRVWCNIFGEGKWC
jgi:hypothetical protein